MIVPQRCSRSTLASSMFSARSGATAGALRNQAFAVGWYAEGLSLVGRPCVAATGLASS